MMRSMYSGVSGLKVHQTKMDVIGNNIANVNTVGFKSSSVTFSDILYQTTAAATGPNETTGSAGINAMQIGLGSNVSSITTNISKTGGAQRTDNWSDLMIEGDGFFIVNSNGSNYFTKAGSFNVDAAGNLCTASGALVMGWQVSQDDPNQCKSDTVSPLRVMSPENMYAPPEATTNVYVSGNIDSNDTQIAFGTEGRVVNVQFYDQLGNLYSAAFTITQDEAPENTNLYAVKLRNVYDASGESVFVNKIENEDGTITYESTPITSFNFGVVTGDTDTAENVTVDVDTDTGEVTIDMEGVPLMFSASTGQFLSIGDGTAAADEKQPTSISFNLVSDGGPFVPIDVDFSSLTMYSQSGTTSLESTKGSLENGYGAGCAVGNMSGISIDKNGKIYGTYDNGNQKLLGEIVVATFANPAGLESVGNNMYAMTQNSGDFDGIGVEIGTTGGKFNTGVLEMSNVDLASEFTEMITTQRGFQANSRIITTSDTLLEELINLKR
ncbi:MAG: flagellar hook protein FlgE [Lachnospiraceae bacterium]|nr:flagellar hook protein FlgE [Lachnospiraceae bacterium]